MKHDEIKSHRTFYPGTSSNPVALVVLIALACVLYAVFIARTHFILNGEVWFTLVDDAMISMRYARNLALGHGLVWNIGEPPIEGFTNPLWTVWMAVIHLIGISESKRALAVMISSAMLLLMNAVFIGRITKKIMPEDRFAPFIAMALTLCFYPLVFWSLRGLEVGFVTTLISLFCLLVFSAVSVDRPGVKLIAAIVIVASLAVATRFDAILQVGCGLLFLFVYRHKTGLICGGLVACFALGILGGQYIYFGDLFPNTYYLKLAGIPLSTRLYQGFSVAFENAFPSIVLPFILCAAALAFQKDFRRKEMAFLMAMFFVQFAYSIWVGGDYAELSVRACNRFITQGAPFLLCVCALAASRFGGMLLQNRQQSLQGSAITLGIAACLLVPITGVNWKNWVMSDAEMLSSDIWRARRGHMIKMATDDRTVIAVHAAGNIPYFAGCTTIDLLGKSDRHIARTTPKQTTQPGHDRWEYDYSIGRKRPDLVADEWGGVSEFMSREMNDQYERLPCGMYIRHGTNYVNAQRLSCSNPP